MQAKSIPLSTEDVHSDRFDPERELPADPLGKNWRTLTDKEIKQTPISELYRRLSVLRDCTHAHKILLRPPHA
jgi:hypothetical protein